MTSPAQQPKKNDQIISFTKNLLAGGVSGAISKTVTAPIERVKLLIQTQAVSEQLGKGTALYKGPIDAFIRIPKEQGIASFWRGNFSNVLRYFPTQALNFALKDKFKQMFKYDPKTEFWKFFAGNLASGGLAGGASLCVVYPLDFTRTRLATDIATGANREFNGIIDCLRKIYVKDGLRGIYRGFAVSVTGAVVYRAGFFGGYDTAKTFVFKKDERPGFWKSWLVAQGVTLTAAYCSYPFDTIRRRLMMQSGRQKSAIVYNGSLDCIAHMIRNEGYRSFYKGALSNAIRTSGAALVLVIYDQIQAMMGMAGGNSSE